MPKQSLDNLTDFSLPLWDELPDIDIYMDQLVTIVERCLHPLSINGIPFKPLTPSMVNNYVKLKLIPKPVKKKYTRQHIARIIVITILKQVFDIPSIQKSIDLQTENTTSKEAYDLFCEYLHESFHAFSTQGETIIFNNPDTNVAPIRWACITIVSKLFTEHALVSTLKHINEKELPTQHD